MHQEDQAYEAWLDLMVNVPHPSCSSVSDSSVSKSTATYMLGLEVWDLTLLAQVTFLMDPVSPLMSWGAEKGF